MTMSSESEVLVIVQELLSAVRRLSALYPGRSFTLDGHLVGSIGEVLAAELYRLSLLPASTERHDAVAEDGRRVQIKLTQTNKVSLYSEPDYLVVLRLTPNGKVEEVYNGPGGIPWPVFGNPQKNGQRSISLARLRGLAQQIEPLAGIERRSIPEWFLRS